MHTRILTAVLLMLIIAIAPVYAQSSRVPPKEQPNWTAGPKARLGIGSANQSYAERYLDFADYILWLEDNLELTDEQKEKLIERRLQDTIEENEYHSRMNVFKRELADLLEKDEIDMDEVSKKIKEMEELRSRHTIQQIESHVEGRSVLTGAQREKLDKYKKDSIVNEGFAPYRDSEYTYPPRTERIKRNFQDR